MIFLNPVLRAENYEATFNSSTSIISVLKVTLKILEFCFLYLDLDEHVHIPQNGHSLFASGATYTGSLLEQKRSTILHTNYFIPYLVTILLF